MAISATTVWEAQTVGSDTANGGGFDPGNASMAADLAATSGTTISPVVTSASYNFAARDVGALVFVKSGTNWTPGWYPIASVSLNAATLNAAAGAVALYGGATVLNTVAGVATVASPTAGTWSIDYSQSATPGIAYTDLVIDGTTNTKYTSVANPVGPNVVGNILSVTAGTGFTVQRVQVLSVVTTTATVDKSLGTLASTGGTGGLGGCLASPTGLAANMVSSNLAWLKNGTYASTAITFGQASVTPSSTVPATRIVGYAVTRGDITPHTNNQSSRPQVLCTTLNATVVNFTNGGWRVENLVFGPSVVATCGSAIVLGGASSAFVNCKATAFSIHGIQASGTNCGVYFCEFTGGTAGNAINVNTSGCAYGNWVHDNACTGIAVTGAVQAVAIVANILSNNSGATSDGIQLSSAGQWIVVDNTIYKSGRDGIRMTVGNMVAPLVRNNLIALHSAGFGINQTTAAWPAMYATDGNAFWSNTSGNRNNLDDTTTNPVDGVGPYVNTKDIVLSADPFANAASNDFRPNSTAGGGGAIQGHGVPSTWPALTATSATDMGAIQHAAPPSTLFVFRRKVR